MWTRRIARLAGLAAVGAGLLAAPARAGERTGAFLFAAHCAPCHGREGRGDGVDAGLFSPPPRNLRDGVLAQYGDDDLVERIRHGRPLGLARDPAALRARAEETELLVGYIERLPKIRWRVVERGEELYVERCEICHGPFGRAPEVLPAGVTKPPRDLSDPAYQRATNDRTLRDRMSHGHRAMPAIPGLDVEENRQAVLAFVRLLSPGYERYSRLCAGCHGEDGRGPGVDWATVKRPTVVFDAKYLAKKDPEALRKDAWHMLESTEPQMPHMSRMLRPSEMRAILTYLRSLPSK